MSSTENKQRRVKLDVGCLKDIIDALRESYFPNHRWFPLGLQLGLLQPTLTEIEANHRDDVERCLHECLTKWLSRADKVDENGGPTINSLVDALKKIGEVATAIKITELLKESSVPACKVLQKYLGILSTISFPIEVTQMLYMEGVISKETFDEIESSRGLLTDDPLRALSSTVYEDPNKLRNFASVLLQSEDTVAIGNDILKDYDQSLPQVPQPNQTNTVALSPPSLNTTFIATQKLYIPPTYQYNFDQIKVAFGNLIHTIAPLIAKGITSLQELKTYLRRCFPELKPQLSKAEFFDDVMDLMQEKCTIINVACLEAVVECYNIEEAKHHVTAYKSVIDKFCEEIKLNLCENENFMTGPSSLLKCETIKFVLEWEPDGYTLSQIRVLLQKAFQNMAKRVLVKVINEGNSVIVTCYAPRHIVDVLMMEAEKNLHMLIKMGLTKLTIGYHTIFDGNERDKKVRDLLEKVKILEEKVATQKKSLLEKDQEIMKLRSFLKTSEEEIRILQEKLQEITQTVEIMEGDIESAEWYIDSVLGPNITLTSPTTKECEEVMSQFKRQQQTGEQLWITLNKLSPDSLLTVLSSINECVVWRLDIYDSPLDSHCVCELSHVLTQNKTIKELYLFSSPLSPNYLKMLTNALSTNITLKTLWLEDDSNITDEDIPHICHVLSVNTTLTGLYFNLCINITEFGEQQITKVLDNNKTLTQLFINDSYFR